MTLFLSRTTGPLALPEFVGDTLAAAVKGIDDVVVETPVDEDEAAATDAVPPPELG